MQETGYHNTICDQKCLRICHEHCGLKFTTNRNDFIGCKINSRKDGFCHTCGCKVIEHIHVKAEYQKVKVETADYKNLKDQIAKMEVLGLSQQ